MRFIGILLAAAWALASCQQGVAASSRGALPSTQNAAYLKSPPKRGSQVFLPSSGRSAAATDPEDGGIVDELGDKVATDFPPILFDFDSTALPQGSDTLLGQLASALGRHDNWTLVIGGHTDQQGSEEYNRALSERRALAVQQRLLKLHPWTKDRVRSLAWGAERPALEGDDPASQARNRRVEFEFWAR
ncbi:MAG: peptidoglycan-associated lipoprotein [Verrucomicrobiota bacterium]|jgi:peptidoglycan-associated lipoprotein